MHTLKLTRTFSRSISLLFFLFISCQFSFCQLKATVTELWEPVPEKVTTGQPGQAPSDAIVLFDGTDLSKFVGEDGSKAAWKVEKGILTVAPKSQSIKTLKKFGDCQLHIEWRAPLEDTDKGQNKGNSGVFLMERYEIQVLDSYTNKTYSNGQAAAIYKQYIPQVNASKPTGEWQTYDIIFTAPKFNESGRMISPARITLLHNGVLIHNHVALLGPTQYIGMPVYEKHQDKESLMLQNHGDKVSFRNIWIREL